MSDDGLDDERTLLPYMDKLPPEELAALLAEHDPDRRAEICRVRGIPPRKLKRLLKRYARDDDPPIQ